MPITDLVSDPETLTLTLIGEYPVPVERLWDAFADPRQIERFWGPPTWPATFTRHDMAAGGRTEYVMTGPEGESSGGYWTYLAVDEGRSFEVVDGFANDDGTANDDMPNMRMRMSFESIEGGSRLTSVTTFPDLSVMEQLVEMGMIEGSRQAMGQMDEVLADLESFAASRSTDTQLLDDTTVRITRVIRGSVDQVWRAHHDEDLMRRWLLGPDGWTMPICQLAQSVGDSYRYEWESVDGDARFGFEGELIEMEAPHRSVTTERMADTDGPSTTNEMTLTAVTGGTLLSIVVTYPTMELRDQVLGMGMVSGMETSYARLEGELAASAV